MKERKKIADHFTLKNSEKNSLKGPSQGIKKLIYQRYWLPERRKCVKKLIWGPLAFQIHFLGVLLMLYTPQKTSLFPHWGSQKVSLFPDHGTQNMSLFPHWGTQKTSLFPFPRTVFISFGNSDIFWVPRSGNSDVFWGPRSGNSDIIWRLQFGKVTHFENLNVEIVTFFEGCIA